MKIRKARENDLKHCEKLSRINELKNNEDSELEGWGSDIDEVERKIESFGDPEAKNLKRQ